MKSRPSFPIAIRIAPRRVPALVITATILAMSLAHIIAAPKPIWRVVRASSGTDTPSLLRNGSFDQQAARVGEDRSGWQRWKSGFTLAKGEGRNGSTALRVEVASSGGEAGASQTLVLNQTTAAPIVVSGWSRAADVSGTSDSGYSIYVDLVYADGTPLWGQTANFRTGTHDWQRRECVIVPQQPIRSLTVYCLFRGHTGRAWFDDVAVEQSGGGAGSTLIFGDIPIEVTAGDVAEDKPLITATTADNLRLTMD